MKVVVVVGDSPLPPYEGGRGGENGEEYTSCPHYFHPPHPHWAFPIIILPSLPSWGDNTDEGVDGGNYHIWF